MVKLRLLFVGVSVLTLAACAAGRESLGGSGGSGLSGGSGATGIPFETGSGGGNPDGACGYALIATEREPGAILLVLDRSASMDECPNGNKKGSQDCSYGATSKWDAAVAAIDSVLSGIAPDARVGLLLFPSLSDGCGIDPKPQVAVGPLSQTKSAIMGALGSGPFGNTPTDTALASAYANLGALATGGKRAAMLITDGAWNCWSDPFNNDAQTAAIDSEVAQALGSGFQTFAIAVPGASDNELSSLAHLGGTDRVPGCLSKCFDDFGFTLGECCHYATDGASFQSDLTQALNDIASKFLTSCVFKLPKGDDPTKFDPAKVNVIVNFGAGDQLVPKDPAVGWSYVPPGTDEIVIEGPLCQEILTQSGSVQILLGCPTGEVK